MKGRKLTNDQYVAVGRQRHGNKYDYSLTNYTTLQGNIIIGCPIHGFISVGAEYHLTSEVGCAKCGIQRSSEKRAALKNKIGKETFEIKAKGKHGETLDYSEVNYVNSVTPVKLICPKHGAFMLKPSYHLQGQGCAKCSTERVASHFLKPFEDFQKQAKETHGNVYTYIKGSYTSSRTPMTIICKTHGAFSATPDNHINKKSGCPKCVHQVSSQEEVLVKQFPFFKQTCRGIIAPYHLDLYSEEHKLAVEVNGMYWHSEEKGKGEFYHLNKTKACAAKGIKLLHFWDKEITHKLPIVLSMVASSLAISEKIYARTTYVGRPSKEEVKNFLIANHLQGAAVHKEAYGLYKEGELLSLMTLSKPRFNKSYNWEIVRLATKTGITVVGGASKLFSAFIKEFNPASVISYADRRYSEGNVYTKLGFTLSHESKPNYMYCKDSVVIPRYAAQKHKLATLLGDKFDSSKSESENMLASGYYKVYDCGNKVFTWKP